MSEILVVEDNPQSLNLVRTLLELEAHDVLEASTVEEAKAVLAKRHPALVLLDIRLPGGDGGELLEAIRADAATRRLPVVAMTAYAMRGDEDRFIGQGFDGYLSKPLDTRTFGSSVAAYMESAEG